MSKVDWSLAPSDATHFHQGSYEYSPHWRKDGYFCVTDFEKGGWKEDLCPIHISQYIERERPQPKPWSGPEDGLPPSEWCSVGKMVQVVSLPTHHHEDVSIYLSKPSKIVASYTGDDGDTFLMLRIDCDFGTGYECFAAHRVLPTKTENQLAADKRETAIEEMAKVLPSAKHECWTCNPDGSVKPYENTYEVLGLLVDAGFKREVK